MHLGLLAIKLSERIAKRKSASADNADSVGDHCSTEGKKGRVTKKGDASLFPHSVGRLRPEKGDATLFPHSAGRLRSA
jgi:hypothetical protein